MADLTTGEPQTAEVKTTEEWAEEGGIRLRVMRGRLGDVFEIVDITEGWPGKTIARATLANYRAKRVAAFLGERLS